MTAYRPPRRGARVQGREQRGGGLYEAAGVSVKAKMGRRASVWQHRFNPIVAERRDWLDSRELLLRTRATGKEPRNGKMQSQGHSATTSTHKYVDTIVARGARRARTLGRVSCRERRAVRGRRGTAPRTRTCSLKGVTLLRRRKHRIPTCCVRRTANAYAGLNGPPRPSCRTRTKGKGSVNAPDDRRKSWRHPLNIKIVSTPCQPKRRTTSLYSSTLDPSTNGKSGGAGGGAQEVVGGRVKSEARETGCLPSSEFVAPSGLSRTRGTGARVMEKAERTWTKKKGRKEKEKEYAPQIVDLSNLRTGRVFSSRVCSLFLLHILRGLRRQHFRCDTSVVGVGTDRDEAAKRAVVERRAKAARELVRGKRARRTRTLLLKGVLVRMGGVARAVRETGAQWVACSTRRDGDAGPAVMKVNGWEQEDAGKTTYESRERQSRPVTSSLGQCTRKRSLVLLVGLRQVIESIERKRGVTQLNEDNQNSDRIWWDAGGLGIQEVLEGGEIVVRSKVDVAVLTDQMLSPLSSCHHVLQKRVKVMGLRCSSFTLDLCYNLRLPLWRAPRRTTQFDAGGAEH
ncbi:hypothetical protein B0H16DRAFT_1466130 [Mycena metata]|uniref:Uncharacterized protein n=1 Tax=Mycena metata TaxID=1033252 RepID=A0AAD7MY91_9AGAR|nr:hypothetical protein B0H16DRAFT_1466130 [Mycena metata]